MSSQQTSYVFADVSVDRGSTAKRKKRAITTERFIKKYTRGLGFDRARG